ncbi:type II toxin-antitoxin system PemK/MazF family toxin [Corynebacterium bovis]|uniref:type II toxin-antitoxin system PemK/MazF family toxin n=2 Tax=Corynebacterium bovis TaxID=36808 RepID=UPI0021AB168B|nr:type II toxin-antitoxin system PemK/MazF family toxin [Corynebacterium bovis]MDH2456114.1 type II toxin-antitoxin system PemK/MazF family toxin [Corynebacterium bovis]MDN8579254.1 type II toxin-antitoxin system PemK/MazF family toxin [Corynebacterium bovis]
MAAPMPSDGARRTPPGPRSEAVQARRKGGFLRRVLWRCFHHRGSLDEGLSDLRSTLGFTRDLHDHRDPTEVTVATPTRNHARVVMYVPDMDGQADSGEIVWTDIRRTRESPVEQRAVLVVGRYHHRILALLISSNPQHGDEDNWLAIGSGPWDPSGNECWVRLDKVVDIPESQIQRKGAVMPERRFERIGARLRRDYSWN